MRPNFVDIENEFREIAVEVEHLSRLLSRIVAPRPDDDRQAAWEAGHICASSTNKIYTGCERIMARVASAVDGTPITHSDGWHAALLRRIAHPFPGVRDAVISAACHHHLDRLRAFRHRVRNTYGVNLDYQIVVERGREAVAMFEMFRAEVGSFLSSRA